MEKRRFIDLLPSVHQTETLRKFFGTTLDQVFQPGQSENFSAYIGRKPSYHDEATDLYKIEPTIQRRVNQLEPTMFSINADGEITHTLFYDDFINHLKIAKGNVDDHERLFADEIYAWSPPVDVNKLDQFKSYVWFGHDPDALPFVTLTSPRVNYTGDGVTRRFVLPEAHSGVDESLETPMLFVDRVPTPFDREGDEIIPVYIPGDGAQIVIFRYGDLAKVVEGAPSFDARDWTDEVDRLTSNMRVFFADGLSRFEGFDTQGFDGNFLSYPEVKWDVPPFDTVSFDHGVIQVPWDKNRRYVTFTLEGIGDAIKVVDYDTLVDIEDPIHVVIDRRSRDRNPWTLANYWFHEDSYAWSGRTFDRRAKRPIIEFLPDIQLHDYGRRRILDVAATMSNEPVFGPYVFENPQDTFKASSYDVFPWDIKHYEAQGIEFVDVTSMSGRPVGTLYADGNHRIMPGDRVLVLDSSDDVIRHRILTAYGVAAEVPVDPTQPEGRKTVRQVYAFETSQAPQEGDVVRVSIRGAIPFDETTYDEEPWEFSNMPLEYWFDGTSWNIAQTRRADTDNDPRFSLYTREGIDHARVEGSTFAGNRLFGFAPGVGANDTVLDRAIRYDKFGEIVFENDMVTQKTLVNGAPVGGFNAYRVNADDPSEDRLFNAWHPTGEKSSAEIVDGVTRPMSNLTANADNDEVTFISRAQWLDHFREMVEGQETFEGGVFVSNNWRDTKRDLSKGRSITQNHSSLLKAMLLASDKRFDYMDAVRFVEHEYVRFRNKFMQQIVEISQSGELGTENDPFVWCEFILRRLSITKTSEFPFYLSIVGGDQYYIPPSPAFMGLLPLVRPRAEIDETFASPIPIIVGHDGSRTPGFADFRDEVLFALELRIYDSAPTKFKRNTMVRFDFHDYIEGRNRLSSPSSLRYTRDEITRMLTPHFMRWAKINGLDYRLNTTYIASDPFTYNYRGVPDRDGNPCPGHWRAIYRWFYDTDIPHSHPWEMLGFAEKPLWWDAEYGLAPYTKGNTKLWEDLRDGRIRSGPRRGIDARFTRPDLLDILPVDAGGRLLDPIAIGLVSRTPSQSEATRGWVPGDHGPVENLWLMSPAYRFTLSILGYLIRPAEWIDTGWDTLNKLYLADGQRISIDTDNRTRASQYRIHGERDENGSMVGRMGIQQWISDLMNARAQDPALLGDALRGMRVRLAHRMAGFTDKSNLRVFADNLGILPEEDFRVLYHQAPPFKEAIYSGLVIEWTGDGWRIDGFDDINESFTTIEGGNPYTYISVGPQDKPVYEWRPGVYYQENTLVDHENTRYRAVRSHLSGGRFEDEFWQTSPRPDNRSPRVRVSNSSSGVEAEVPYGTVFTSVEQVANFIRDYARWLESQGWVFDGVDPNTGEVQDWDMAIREFLKWAQMDWQPGAFISLSPGASSLKFIAPHGTVYNIEETANGLYGLIDRSGAPIARRDTFVSRLDEETKIITVTDDLFGARLRIGEIEHIVTFSQVSVFDDVIYQPLFDLRQPRLRMIGKRTMDWKGRRDARGYIIVGDEIVPSFDRQSENLREMFEIEKVESRTLRDQARQLIGFQTRQYLDNLLLSETQQFEFYQGMIQAKGSPGVFNKLTRSTFIEQDRDLSFQEEWALRLGEYGQLDSTSRVSFMLSRSDIRSTPQLIMMGDAPQTIDVSYDLPQTSPRWIEKPVSTNFVFPTTNDTPHEGLPNAGYVRTDEVEYIIFRPNLLASLFTQFGGNFTSFDRIWVYDTGRGQNSFDVQELQPVTTPLIPTIRIEGIQNDPALEGIRIVFAAAHGMTQDDVGRFVLLTQSALDGFYEVQTIESTTSIILTGFLESGIDYDEGGLIPEDRPQVHVLRSLRFATLTTAVSTITAYPPNTNRRLYIDSDGSGWGVYMQDPVLGWQPVRRQPQKIDSRRVINALIYDNRVEYSQTSLSPQPVRFGKIGVYDPHLGLIPGSAEKELTYKLDADPAHYDTGVDQWGREQVGHLWWDISTVRYLVNETDILDPSDPARYEAELSYRIYSWGQIAPGSSIDIYEWTRSLRAPDNNVARYRTNNVVAKQETDPATGRLVTAYYYWVRNPTGVPRIQGRSIPALQVATIIENPKGQDLAWIAPVSQRGIIVSGLAQHLNDVDSVLQLEVVQNQADGARHTEWALVSPQGERKTAPDAYWDRLRDSLAGIDQMGRVVSNGLFATDRATIKAARAAFFGRLDAIFTRSNMLGNNAGTLRALDRQTPVPELLFWMQGVGSNAFEEPLHGTYDGVSQGLDERGEVLDTQPFRRVLDALRRGERPQERSPRLLVTNYDGPRPSWGIWEIDYNASDFHDPDVFLTLAKAFDMEVASRADRDALFDIPLDTLVLVREDEAASGFWTLWRYRPATPRSDSKGFVLVTAQTYRTRDFIETRDWYDERFDPNRPPLVTYATIAQRDLGEGSNPRNIFVRVDDDLTGSWIWSVYQDNVWQTVARQNGTASFSSRLYESDTVYGVENFDLSAIPSRDGTKEIQIIVDALRDTILSHGDLNELFFGLIHFIHSGQDQVDWAFKTSFMNVVNFDERLRQSPLQRYDNTDNLIEYIKEVKPYHVTIRDFARILSPDREDVFIDATDFDKPVYFDTIRRIFRTLDETNAGDEDIMRRLRPWSHWIENYLNESLDPQSASYMPVRRFMMNLLFDRVDPNPDAPLPAPYLQTTALKRFLDHYEPGTGMVEKEARTHFGLDFKDYTFNGNILFERDILDRWDTLGFDQSRQSKSPLDDDVFLDGNAQIDPEIVLNANDNHHTFADPIWSAHRPEEFARLRVHENLKIVAHSRWTKGAPRHAIRSTYHEPGMVNVSLPSIAAHNDAIGIYVNGTRLDPQSYTVDHFAKTVETTLSTPSTIMAHTIGSGTPSRIVLQAFFEGTGEDTFTLHEAALGHAEAIVEGVEHTATLTGNTVIVSPTPPVGSDVMITIYADERVTRPHRQRMGSSPVNAWIIDNPTDTRDPEEASIVEVNGLRLTPPRFHYGSLPNNRVIEIGHVADMNNVKIFLDGVEKLPPLLLDREPERVPLPGIDFAYFDGRLYATNKALTGNLKVIVYENNDYIIKGNVLTIKKFLGFGTWDDLIQGIADYDYDVFVDTSDQDRIEVTTFTNSAVMDIRTMVHLSNDTGLYAIPASVPSIEALHVTVMGRRLIPNSEFYMRDDRTIYIPGTRAYGSLPIVITSYSGAYAEPERRVGLTSRQINGFSIFGQEVFDYDNRRWDSFGLDRLDDTPEAPFMRRLDGYEEQNWEHYGILQGDVSPTDNEIVIHTNPHAVSSDVHPILFPQPSGKPGVAYLGNERIEYWSVETQGDLVTLREIVRGTRGTSLGIEHRETMIAPASQRTIMFERGDANRPIDVLMTVPGGSKRALRPGDDYTVVANLFGGLTVTINEPIVGAMVTIGQSLPALHKSGTKVYPDRQIDDRTTFRGASH